MQTQSNNHNLSRLVIDNIKPKWITCIWLFFFVLLGVLFLLVLAIPESVIWFKYNHDVTCPQSEGTSQSEYCKQFSLTKGAGYNPNYAVFLTGMDKKNQFFTLDIKPELAQDALSGNSRLDMKLQFVLEVYELDDNLHTTKELLYRGPQHNLTITCTNDIDDSDDSDDDDNTDAENTVGTRYGSCHTRSILYVNQINKKNFLMIIALKNGEELAKELTGFKAYITTIEAAYTSFLLALRYTCFAISICFAVYYFFMLRKMRGEKLVFEQKFIRVLGILLLFFNDPIYASTILHPTLASAVFSSIFIITFACALLLFWIAAFQRVYRESTQVKSRALSWIKLIYIFFLWLFSVVAYCILARQYLKDPSFDFNDEYEKTFTAFKVLMIILLGIGLGWMFYGFAQILKAYNSLIWRHKIFFSFSCYFILCYFIFMFTGSVNVYNFNGTKVMLLFGITNVYVWFLQVIYSPSGKGFAGSDQPISLAQEFQGYEMLDENSVNRGEGFDEEVNPDQILFQFDNNGEIYQKQAQPQAQAQIQGSYQQSYGQSYGQPYGGQPYGGQPYGGQPSTNFDNFGASQDQDQGQGQGNNFADFGTHGGNAQVEMVQQHNNQKDDSAENKYPYELNHEEFGE